MRTIVFFDLPNIYSKDKRNYLLFRKYLINEGFIMMQMLLKKALYKFLLLQKNNILKLST